MRVIKVSAQAMEALREYKKVQAAERLRLGSAWVNTGKVFTTWNGDKIHPDTVTGWFKEFAQRQGWKNITVHSLRHTNASLLIANHTPTTTVSKRLGHANTNTTNQIYAHAIRSADEKAADMLGDILVPDKAKNA